MKARELMTEPVITVPEEARLREVAALLLHERISGAPVIDQEGQLVGIISEADFLPLQTGAEPHLDVMAHPAARVPHTVAEVMTREVATAPPDADAAYIAKLMSQRGVKRIPIVEQGRVVGIVTRGDLLRSLSRSDDEIRVEVQRFLDEELIVLGHYTAAVHDAVVTLVGPSDRQSRRLAERLIRSVPGVEDVEFATPVGALG